MAGPVRSLRRLGGALAALCVASLAGAQGAGESSAYPLEDLYGLPRLDGTPPVAASW